MNSLVSPGWLLPVVRGAFMADVRWDKPGNVSRASPGHGMTAEDFERSAPPAAKALVASAQGVGNRIRAGVEASRAAAGCNTNLGILLLVAPLVEAALLGRGEGGLRCRLERVLGQLTCGDAEDAFAAIRMAAPGGLGNAERHDVLQSPRCALREAMEEAADRDLVARQYANGYAQVLDAGAPALAEALRRHGARGPALAELQLTYLSRYPDSHVQRKHGAEAAERVREQGERTLRRIRSCPRGPMRKMLLAELDQALKKAGINPGTSADLTVATLIAFRLGRREARIRARGVYSPLGQYGDGGTDGDGQDRLGFGTVSWTEAP